jgi:hypothetical protein
MIPLLHNYTKKAGRVFEWDTSDSQQAYLKNLTDPKLKQRLTELGFVDRPIEYKFNSHGFRTEEFENQIDAVCFGCSFTMGTGVHAIDTWPSQLAQLTGLRTTNLGHAGSSNDTVFRFAEHYLKSLRPKYAIWLQTDMHRIELIDQANSVTLNILASDTTNPCANDYYTKIWFASDINHQLNYNKNTRAFRHLCQELQIKSIILHRDQVPSHGLFPYSSARDLTHPGARDYQQLATQIAGLLNTY